VQEFDFKSTAGDIKKKMNGKELQMYPDDEETLAGAGERNKNVQAEKKTNVPALIKNEKKKQKKQKKKKQK
ncbi:hypothetical protein C1Y47_26075, partial [Priestia megaterium]